MVIGSRVDSTATVECMCQKVCQVISRALEFDGPRSGSMLEVRVKKVGPEHKGVDIAA